MRYVISLTTTPMRLPKVYRTLETLQAQTVQPLDICLCIPFVFKGTGRPDSDQNIVYDEAVVQRYQQLPGVSVIRGKDQGPITKLVPTLKKHWGDKELCVVVLDDDINYHPNHCETLLRAMGAEPGGQDRSAFGIHCSNTYTSSTCMLEAYAGYIVRVGYFQDDFWSYLAYALTETRCFTGDDYIVSNYLASKAIVLKSALPDGWTVDTIHQYITYFEHSHTDDALWKLAPSSEPDGRYGRCAAHLERKGLSAALALATAPKDESP